MKLNEMTNSVIGFADFVSFLMFLENHIYRQNRELNEDEQQKKSMKSKFQPSGFDKKQYLDAIKVHHYSYKLLSGIDRHY